MWTDFLLHSQYFILLTDVSKSYFARETFNTVLFIGVNVYYIEKKVLGI